MTHMKERKESMITRTTHNCTKEPVFEFVSAAMTSHERDVIRCVICERVWQELREAGA